MFVISSSKHKVIDPLSRRRNNQQFVENNFLEYNDNDNEDEEEQEQPQDEETNTNDDQQRNSAENDDDEFEMPLLNKETHQKPKLHEMGGKDIIIEGLAPTPKHEKNNTLPEPSSLHQKRRPSAVILHSENSDHLANIFVGSEGAEKVLSKDEDAAEGRREKSSASGSKTGKFSSNNNQKKKQTDQHHRTADSDTKQEEEGCCSSLCYTIAAFFREFILALVLFGATFLVSFLIYNYLSEPNFGDVGNSCVRCLRGEAGYTSSNTSMSHTNNTFMNTTTSATITTLSPSSSSSPTDIQFLFNKTDGACIPFQRNLTFSMSEIIVFPDFCPSLSSSSLSKTDFSASSCANHQTLPGSKPTGYLLAAVLIAIAVLFSSLFQVLKYFLVIPLWDACSEALRNVCWFACCCCMCYCCWTEQVDEDDDETCCEKYSVFRLQDERDATDVVKKKMLAKKKREKREKGELTTEDEKATGEFDLFETQEARSLAVVFRCFGTLDPRYFSLVYLFAVVHLIWILVEVGSSSSLYRARYFNATLNTKFFYPNLVLAQDKTRLDLENYAREQQSTPPPTPAPPTTTTLLPPGPNFIPLPPSGNNGAGSFAFRPKIYSSPTAIVDLETSREVDPFAIIEGRQREAAAKNQDRANDEIKNESPLYDSTSNWLIFQTVFFTWVNSGSPVFICLYYANWLCYWYSYALAKTSCGADSDSDDDADEQRSAKGFKKFRSLKQIRRARIKRQKLIEVRITFEEEVMLKGDHTDSFANRILFPVRGLTLFFPRRTSSYNDAVRMQRILDEEFADCSGFDEQSYYRELTEDELAKRQKRIQQRMKQDSERRESVSRSYYKLARNLQMYFLLIPIAPVALTHIIPALGLFIPITLAVAFSAVAFCAIWLVVVKWFERANAKRAALIVALLVARIIGAVFILFVTQTMMSYATLFYSGEYAWHEVIQKEYQNRDTQCFVQGLSFGVRDITMSSVIAFVV